MGRQAPRIRGMRLAVRKVRDEMAEEEERERLGKKEVLTAKEAAWFLRVSRDAIYLAVNRGEVPHGKIGRRLVFSRQALLEWLEAKVRPVSADALDPSDE